MSFNHIRQALIDHLEHVPTGDQQTLLQKLSGFLLGEDETEIFLLKGYAGTGKTTVVGAVVRTLAAMRWKSVLLAPTGRAAKVLSGYAGSPAHTIHKKIYRQRRGPDGGMRFARMENLHTRTLFIVDEASMISGRDSEQGGFGGAHLLDDLIEYVFSGQQCLLLFVGDTAQLPPVGDTLSPALDRSYLQNRYGLVVEEQELQQVVRQEAASGILHNATALRQALGEQALRLPTLHTDAFADIQAITGEELEELLHEGFDRYGAEETMVVCRSNKRANLFNQQIRARIRWVEEEIAAGDYLMVVRNNYFWLEKDSPAGFIANGDIVEVLRVAGRQELYGFRFADLTIRLVDYPDEPDREVKVLLDTLTSPGPALGRAEQEKLYHAVMEDYQEYSTARDRNAKVRQDPFYNALQVKFAYAVTCHKAQGGQWECVFLDAGYLTDEMINAEFLRWLYTAVTRASRQLYLVNFPPQFLP